MLSSLHEKQGVGRSESVVGVKKVNAEFANRTVLRKTGAMRLQDGLFPCSNTVRQKRALKISTDYAQTLPFRECVTFIVKGHLHTASRLEREVNQSVLRRLVNVDEL
jgi:hypothetical protein